ncbi:MAG: DUF429 domain-containing protein [Reyranella sp.]|nr:DUF429 domain-containing protein [Reyranella sp.]
MIVAGADGCRSGWVVCRRDADGSLSLQVVKALAEACEGLSILAVDMPIGLLDVPRPGGRDCEREARALMPGKASSVFSSPCRPALACQTYRDANATSRRLGAGLSAQAFGLATKLRELDAFLRNRPDLAPVFHEAHPELAFARMNGGKPVLSKKKSAEGEAERRRLLIAHGFDVPVFDGAPANDVLDSVAVCRTALLIGQGSATCLGPAGSRDRHGLPMNIWF